MSNLISPIKIEQQQYDKISDDIYLLGTNAILRFTVNLSKTYDNMRYHYHKEYEYNSKYSNSNKLITLKRSFDFFLSLENIKRDDNGNKEFIIIGAQNILLFKYKLQEAMRWFMDKEFENLFGKKGKKILLLGRVNSIKIDKLPMDKYLEFEPVVCDFETDMVPGVRIYLSSIDNFVDMTLDRFMGLYYLIDTFNMYESAQLMINYLQRPEYGTNLYSFAEQYQEENTRTIDGTKAKEGRKIPVKNRGLKDFVEEVL